MLRRQEGVFGFGEHKKDKYELPVSLNPCHRGDLMLKRCRATPARHAQQQLQVDLSPLVDGGKGPL